MMSERPPVGNQDHRQQQPSDPSPSNAILDPGGRDGRFVINNRHRTIRPVPIDHRSGAPSVKTEHEWVQTRVTIQNRQGLHARPVMSFVDVANGFASGIRVGKGDHEVDGKSIMQMMQLFAGQGTELTIRASGPDAADALAQLTELVDRKFDED